jgi:cellulose synthase/poly-beta-1,6-N-acetylglucosamine synthase-like glycosyltransferase
VIVVDDHSDDNTPTVVAAYTSSQVRCISLADGLPPGARLNSYKKAALTAGIQDSRGSLIITTDADCTAPAGWLLQIAAYYQQQQPSMIVAPVMFTNDGSLVQTFQCIDFMTMQGITGATHRLKLGQMSNGANLAFSKKVFNAVGGYTGVDHLATGDDYLLMMKIAKHPGATIAYLKSPAAVISTLPQTTWSGFLQQRIRWASKSGKYDDKKLTLVLLLVYLYNVSFLAMVFIGLFMHPFLCLAGCLLAAKIAAEYLLLIPTAMFFKRISLLLWFPFLQPLHICYIIAAGFLGFVGKYQWKGREVK